MRLRSLAHLLARLPRECALCYDTRDTPTNKPRATEMNRLLDFICPQCGQESRYDPWEGSAQCPNCDYSPLDGPLAHRGQPAEAHSTHERFLDELADHWNGTHRPQRELPTPTDDFAQVFFASYQQTMGEDPDLPNAMHSRYARSYVPDSAEVSSFARAYTMLKRGERVAAERAFRDLTVRAPAFADAWV